MYHKSVPGEPIRLRLPRGTEILGEIEELLGGSRFKARCTDGNTRICRIPGKFRKRVKIRMGDIVIVKPWSIEPKEKGDIEWIYNKTQMALIKKKGLI